MFFHPFLQFMVFTVLMGVENIILGNFGVHLAMEIMRI